MTEAWIDNLFTDIAELAVILTLCAIVLMIAHAALRPKQPTPTLEPGERRAQ